MRLVVLAQKLQKLINIHTAKLLPFFKWIFKQGTAQVIKKNQQVVRVDQRLLGRARKKVFRMVSQELVEGVGCGN